MNTALAPQPFLKAIQTGTAALKEAGWTYQSVTGDITVWRSPAGALESLTWGDLATLGRTCAHAEVDLPEWLDEPISMPTHTWAETL